MEKEVCQRDFPTLLQRQKILYIDLCIAQSQIDIISWIVSAYPVFRHKLESAARVFAYNYDYISLATMLERHIKMIPNEKLLVVINVMRATLFTWKPKNLDMISFQRCCHILHSHFSMTEKFITVMSKLYERNQKRAQQRLYFWWIPICYDLKRDCGQRMMEKIWNRIEDMYIQV